MNGIGFRLWLANKEIFKFADRPLEYSEGEFPICAKSRFVLKPESKTVFSFSFLYITTSSTSYVYVLSTLKIEHRPPSCSSNSPYSVIQFSPDTLNIAPTTVGIPPCCCVDLVT